MQNHISVDFRGDIAIAELAHAVATATGYHDAIGFDQSRLNSPSWMWMDSSHLNELGWNAQVELEKGSIQAFTGFMAINE